MSVGMIMSTHNDATVNASFALTIHKRYPVQTALLGLISRMGKEAATNTQHGYKAKTLTFITFNSTGADAAGAGILNVSSVENIVAGHTFQNFRTKEEVIVNSVLSSTTLSVSRGMGTVAAAGTLANDPWYHTGNAFEEGSIRPNPVHLSGAEITNRTHIIRNSWALSDTARALAEGKNNTEIGTVESKAEAALLHALALEQALWWSQAYSGTRNGAPFRKMDGLISQISQPLFYPAGVTPNVETAGATTNFDQLVEMVDSSLDSNVAGGSAYERIIFGGKQAIQVINRIGSLSGQTTLQPNATSFGLRFTSANLGRGTFHFMNLPMFDHNPNWSKMGVVTDISSLKLAYLYDRDTMHKEFNSKGQDAADNGIDAVGGTFTSEATLVNYNPTGHAIIYNLTQAA